MPTDDRVEPADPKPPPESKPTVLDLKAPPPWAIELTRKVIDGFAATESHFDRQDATLATLTNNDLTASARMARFEVRLDSIEERQNRSSLKVGTVSQNDMAQEAKLADQIVKQQQLEDAIHETRTIAESTAKEIAKQSDYMGMGKAGLKWLGSTDGRTTLLQAAAALYAVWEVLKHGGIVK